MPEPSNQASHRQRRAKWVALRTLRQLPTVVGETADGETIYEIRSVRLMLRGLSTHFNRVAPCARCGRELPAAPVLTSADLDRPVRPMICDDCVRRTGISAQWQPDARRAAAPPLGADDVDVAPEVVEPEPLAVPAGDRLDALAQDLHEVAARVEELAYAAQAQQASADERREQDASAHAALQATLAGALSQARAEMTSLAEAGTARSGALEDEARQALDSLAQHVERQNQELAAMKQHIDQARFEMQRMSDANAVVVSGAPDPGAIDELVARRVADAEARLAVVVPGAPNPGAIEDLVAEAEARLADRVEAARAASHERHEQTAAALTHLVEAQRASIEDAFSNRLEAALASAVRDLTEARDQLAGEVDALVQRMADIEARIGVLTHAAEVGATRLRGLEGRMSAVLAAAARVDQPPATPSRPGDLLDSLERQLQDAENRLWQLGESR